MPAIAAVSGHKTASKPPSHAVDRGTRGPAVARTAAAHVGAAAPIGVSVSTLEAAAPGTFCAELWASVAGPGGIFNAVMEHPFLSGLTDGSLEEAAFRGYLVQGCLYLREFGRALAVLAAKAPDPAWTAFLARCVQESHAEEKLFHEVFLGYFGTSVERETASTALSPNSQLYSSYILSTVHERGFCEGLAAVLPCFVLYLEMGKGLLPAGSPHPLYQRFIDRFAGPEYELLTLEVVGVMNAAAQGAGEGQLHRMRLIFQHCCRMEYLFFDGAYAQQSWPI